MYHRSCACGTQEVGAWGWLDDDELWIVVCLSMVISKMRFSEMRENKHGESAQICTNGTWYMWFSKKIYYGI